MEQFSKDYSLGTSIINQENGQMVSLGQMDAFDLDRLAVKGLGYDKMLQRSDDFVIVYRYGDDLWKFDWQTHNRVFACHMDSSVEEVKRVDEICAMTMEEIAKLTELGEYLFSTIWNKSS